MRRNVEAKIKEQYTTNPLGFAQSLIAGLAKDQPQEVATMSCVLLKKYFLDSRASPDFQPTELSASDIQSLLLSVIHSCEFDS